MKVASFEFQQIAKQEMGFVTEPKHCRDCVFYESVEDPALDRSWIPCCKMFETLVGLIAVTEYGSCRRWEKK